ncbi:N-acyl-D-aspartate/D-glutamate deacylase [Mycobacteroides abscessus subsp. massiliense]|nr:N-acyl-D-aspartate/D-glutamate deacylase [Mycobacteroides abscessus subsp. massiliense]
MVNRNDETVCSVLVGGHGVVVDGKPTEILGKERTGVFLRGARTGRQLVHLDLNTEEDVLSMSWRPWSIVMP